MPHVVGSDIGGTFTDLVMLNEATGTVVVEKVPSTPQDPADAVLHGYESLRERQSDPLMQIRSFVHATTLVANTIVERAGARTALLVTEGFRDILRLRRHTRVSTYQLYTDPPAPLVPYRWVFPLRERMRADGRALVPLDPRAVEHVATRLVEEQIESVAVMLLHSYVNPEHEELVGEILASHVPDMPVTLSSALVRKDMEYERASTTVANAYCAPIVGTYVDRLAARVADADVRGQLSIMSSSGGVLSARTAVKAPARLVESGPAAGATYTASLARKLNLPSVLAFDMGGTTAKGCLIQGHELPLVDEIEIARAEGYRPGTGFPLRVPSIDMIEFGSGGGSIVARDEVGVLRVGPRSSGAVPGPACYGRGGQDPTVTDAALVAGHLDAENFLGGDLVLDSAAATKSLDRARGPHDENALDVAHRVQQVVVENMGSAITQHVIERGAAPEDVVMVAFGGAGPIHAHMLARRMGIRTFIVPPLPGVLSAVGLLTAAPSYQETRTVRVELSEFDVGTLTDAADEMTRNVNDVLATVDPDHQPTIRIIAQCAYTGQSSTIPVTIDDIDTVDGEQLQAQFARQYRSLFGYYYDDVAVEVSSLLVEGSLRASQLLHLGERQTTTTSTPRDSHRSALSHVTGKLERFRVVQRSELIAHEELAGPAIVQERESTTIIDVGSVLTVDDLGNLIVTVDA